MRNRSVTRRRRGQGMVEYIIVVGLVAMLAMSSVDHFGKTLRAAFDGTTNGFSSRVTAPIARLSGGSVGPSAGGAESGSANDPLTPVWARVRQRPRRRGQ